MIADRFDFEGEPITVTECLTGHINSTYFVDCSSEQGLHRYVLQILNTNIFKKPDDVMRNILYITKHIENKLEAAGLDSERGTLTVRAATGALTASSRVLPATRLWNRLKCLPR